MAATFSLISWRMQRAWALGAAPWWTLTGALALAAALAALVLAALRPIEQRLQLAKRELAVIEHAAKQPTAARAPVEARDFTHALAPGTPAVQVVEELRRSCERSNVVLASVQVRERAASEEQLGRAELAITLRGSYVNSKQVLKDATDRFSKLTVQRLRLRRVQATSEVETSATLSLWSAALTVPAAKSPVTTP